MASLLKLWDLASPLLIRLGQPLQVSVGGRVQHTLLIEARHIVHEFVRRLHQMASTSVRPIQDYLSPTEYLRSGLIKTIICISQKAIDLPRSATL